MTAQHSAAQPAPDEAPATLADAPAAPSDAEAEQGDLFALDLPKFHGPLELLLHLIERRELDITEV